jgi:hypothetical protein
MALPFSWLIGMRYILPDQKLIAKRQKTADMISISTAFDGF